jgi:hypothetical protein
MREEDTIGPALTKLQRDIAVGLGTNVNFFRGITDAPDVRLQSDTIHNNHRMDRRAVTSNSPDESYPLRVSIDGDMNRHSLISMGNKHHDLVGVGPV